MHCHSTMWFVSLGPSLICFRNSLSIEGMNLFQKKKKKNEGMNSSGVERWNHFMNGRRGAMLKENELWRELLDLRGG